MESSRVCFVLEHHALTQEMAGLPCRSPPNSCHFLLSVPGHVFRIPGEPIKRRSSQGTGRRRLEKEMNPLLGIFQSYGSSVESQREPSAHQTTSWKSVWRTHHAELRSASVEETAPAVLVSLCCPCSRISPSFGPWDGSFDTNRRFGLLLSRYPQARQTK